MESSRIYVLTDFRCNNACVFCDQSQASRELGATDKIAEHVRKLADEGVDAITFCGGEATLDLARLEELVALARELGIDRVGVQTNGRRLAYSNVVQRLVDAGVHCFDVSLHGTNAATHDWVTRDPGSFKQTIRGLKEIRRLGAEMTLHMVLVKSNFRQVREMVLLAAKLRIRALHFRLAVPEGRIEAEGSLPSLVPKYTLVQPLLMLAKATAKRMGVSIYLHDFPDCVAGSLSSDLVRERARWVGEGASDWSRADRQGPADCGDCLAKKQCTGISTAYLEYYGTSEFTPVDRLTDLKEPRAVAKVV